MESGIASAWKKCNAMLMRKGRGRGRGVSLVEGFLAWQVVGGRALLLLGKRSVVKGM